MILSGIYKGSIDGHYLTDGSLDIKMETKFELDLYFNAMFFLPSLKKINTSFCKLFIWELSVDVQTDVSH